jgi:peptidylprolyl isomerase
LHVGASSGASTPIFALQALQRRSIGDISPCRSAGRDPLEFSLGAGNVIPGFDNAVEGMEVGDSKSIKIAADDAYGARHEELIQDVPREHLPDDMKPEVGMQLQAQAQDGQPMQLIVTAVAEETITVDGNHPLAGQSLNFDIELVEIG